ncbi:transposase [Streptomyces heilongjiangensis]|uniref:Transposase n=1 Tax=Streptomyces heilongjiangensis TaxID=945052 RepID=A0ABW1BKE9_9ACTN|nr:transposase [Streptomyces heilongjiangensis]MDC2952122.1 transposase [Streptomyces heilongjiangensis]
MARPSRYPLELRRRAVRMVAEVRDDHPNETAALQAVTEKLGIGSRETLRNWVKRHEIDAGQRPGTTQESAQLKALKKENAELKRANEILKAAASFFAAELDRPHTRS